MAKKANQHYVPQFYFRYFSDDGKSICVLNRSNGKTIERAPIKGQASKKYYYGKDDIETTISEIENHFSYVLREVKKTNTFEGYRLEYYAVFLQNIMFQRSRTISARQKSKAMQDKLLQQYTECSINSDDSLDESKKEAFRSIAQVLEANPQQYQQVGMSVALNSAKSLNDLLPVILHNKTNRPFIFGDAPVILTNPFLKQVTFRGVLGLQSPGLIVLYPLSPSHCVMLIDRNIYKIKKLRGNTLSVRSLQDISMINKLQIHNSVSAVYFSDFKYSQYIKELWQQENDRLVDHVGKVVEAPGYDHNGNSMGDILHFFEEQLPFIPKLSFLAYDEAPEEEECYFINRKDYY